MSDRPVMSNLKMRTVIRRALGLLGTGLMLGSLAATAQTADPGTADDAPGRVQSTRPGRDSPGASEDREKVIIEAARPWLFNRETRYAHSLPEVDGATITVTKKTSVVKLGDQPSVIDNNQRELFDRLPGIVLAEQQNPTQLNLSYRGLGNPQESEYVLLLQDGLPLELDFIGYPTAYYLPTPQSLDSVQMIRGGSGLLYGPEPQPVVNFITRPPQLRPFAATFEEVGGSDNMISSFNRVSGTTGDWDYSLDFSRRQSNGQRLNGDYALDAGDIELGYRIDEHQRISFAAHIYTLQSGLAGLMLAGDFHRNPNLTTTPDDRLWTDRYTGVLSYENRLSERDTFTQKLWSGYTDLITRAGSYTPDYQAQADCQVGGVTVGCTTLAGQRFHYTGLDGRFVHKWARGNALTLGYTVYTSESPYVQERSSDPLVARGDAGGTPWYRDERSTRYGALFAENVFRLPGRVHIVTSARLDHERLSTRETLAQHALLANQTHARNVPLFGIGIGNDFGRGNETYVNVSQGFRPLRYLDIGSPFGNFAPQNNPDPARYLTYEAGVHGWPLPGFYYDVSLFQVNVHDRIESRAYDQIPGSTRDVNTGDTRSRGVEAETSYDLLRLWNRSPRDHLEVFLNGSYLDARFTSSRIDGQVGKVPAYSPGYVLKGGVTLRRDGAYKVAVVLDSVGRQYFQDSNAAIGSTPAQIPGYTVGDLSGEYTLSGHLRLVGGISNFTDRTYYSRVFISCGMVEPGRARNFYAGLACDL